MLPIRSRPRDQSDDEDDNNVTNTNNISPEFTKGDRITMGGIDYIIESTGDIVKCSQPVQRGDFPQVIYLAQNQLNFVERIQWKEGDQITMGTEVTMEYTIESIGDIVECKQRKPTADSSTFPVVMYLAMNQLQFVHRVTTKVNTAAHCEVDLEEDAMSRLLAMTPVPLKYVPIPSDIYHEVNQRILAYPVAYDAYAMGEITKEQLNQYFDGAFSKDLQCRYISGDTVYADFKTREECLQKWMLGNAMALDASFLFHVAQPLVVLDYDEDKQEVFGRIKTIFHSKNRVTGKLSSMAEDCRIMFRREDVWRVRAYVVSLNKLESKQVVPDNSAVSKNEDETYTKTNMLPIRRRPRDQSDDEDENNEPSQPIQKGDRITMGGIDYIIESTGDIVKCSQPVQNGDFPQVIYLAPNQLNFVERIQWKQGDQFTMGTDVTMEYTIESIGDIVECKQRTPTADSRTFPVIMYLAMNQLQFVHRVIPK